MGEWGNEGETKATEGVIDKKERMTIIRSLVFRVEKVGDSDLNADQ
jgi:hypothetical protein